MTRATGYWLSLFTAGVAFALTAATAAADDKEAKKGEKAKEGGQTIVIQIDASKVPPELLKQLAALAQPQHKGGDKKPAANEDDKKPSGKKKDDEQGQHGNNDEDGKKGGGKPNVVQVDLNKLPPDLAKRLKAELDKGKDANKGGKKEGHDDEDDKREGKKGGKKKDKDDDD